MKAGKEQAALEREIVRSLRGSDRVVAVFLFGSQAKGRVHAGSDVDIAVLLDQPPRATERYEVIREILTRLASREMAEQADLVLLNDAPPALAFRILRDGKLLFCHDDVTLHRFRVRTYDLHADLAWLEKRFNRATFERASRVGSDG